jgi:hypothetical protein
MSSAALSRGRVLQARLASQRLCGPRLATPVQAAAHLVAVQAQDYRGGLWAVGLRLRRSTEAAVEAALAAGTIVRTWPLRGTLHIVAAADVRWLLRLLAPRPLAAAAGRHRQLGLDDAVFSRARSVLERALGRERLLTRSAVYELFEKAGIAAAGQRGIHIAWRLAQEGLICHGPRKGRQQTFVLLDDWVPPLPARPREEALADLARRWFSSHGPATLRDFTWWTGLTVAAAREAVSLAEGSLHAETLGETTVYGPLPTRSTGGLEPRVHLLPPFDELLVAYKDREAALDERFAAERSWNLLSPTVIVAGKVVGTWSRRESTSGITVTPRVAGSLPRAARTALDEAVARYAAFSGRPLTPARPLTPGARAGA